MRHAAATRSTEQNAGRTRPFPLAQCKANPPAAKPNNVNACPVRVRQAKNFVRSRGGMTVSIQVFHDGPAASPANQ
jgi:hypothetical protein